MWHQVRVPVRQRVAQEVVAVVQLRSLLLRLLQRSRSLLLRSLRRLQAPLGFPLAPLAELGVRTAWLSAARAGKQQRARTSTASSPSPTTPGLPTLFTRASFSGSLSLMITTSTSGPFVQSRDGSATSCVSRAARSSAARRSAGVARPPGPCAQWQIALLPDQERFKIVQVKMKKYTQNK